MYCFGIRTETIGAQTHHIDTFKNDKSSDYKSSLTVSGSVPVAGVGCVETSATLLHDRTVYCKTSESSVTFISHI